MSNSKKKWSTVGTIGRIDEATFGGDVDAVAVPQSAAKYTAPSGTATEAEVLAALATCYAAKGHLNLRARAADEEFAAELGIELRTNSKGQKLAIQKEDLPEKADLRIVVTVADKDGNPVERRISGTIRHNRSLGLAVASGRKISDQRKQDPEIQEQAKLLGIEASHLRATPEQKRELFSAFFSPYTIRVDLSASRAYLDSLEPKPVSRRKELRSQMKAEGVQKVDDLIASLGLGKK